MTTILYEKCPRLAELAVAQGDTSLSRVAEPLHDDAKLNLKYALGWVQGGHPEQNAAPSPSSYLATIERFLEDFGPAEAPRDRLWAKLSNPGGTEFLDTMGELAVALSWRKGGLAPRVERSFEDRQGSKDADLFLELDGQQLWLDVYSIDGGELPDSFQGPGSNAVRDRIRSKARRKYDAKFRDAVDAGILTKPSAGVLICGLKDEITFLPEALFGQVPTLPPSDPIWEECPGLGIIAVFTLEVGSGEVLRPSFICVADPFGLVSDRDRLFPRMR